MKTNRAFMLLGALGALILSSCWLFMGSIDGNWGDTSVPDYSYERSSSSVVSSPKDELIIEGENGLDVDKEGNALFYIKEFDKPFKLCASSTQTKDTIKYGDLTISTCRHAGVKLVASDINKDGYREIVFFERVEGGRSFVVYDVKNEKTLLREDEMTEEKFGHYANYRFYHDIHNGRLTFFPYIRNLSDETVVDYGRLNWSEEKGCYFRWENIYKIKEIRLKRIFIEGTETTLEPGHGYLSEKDYYTFEIGKNYIMRYSVVRDDYKRDFNDKFLQVTWSDDRPSYFDKWSVSNNLGDNPKEGDYAIRFSVTDAPDAVFTWKWYFASWGFDVNYHVLPRANG